MGLKTDEFACGMKDLFKVKEQAKDIIAEILLLLTNSANFQRDCKNPDLNYCVNHTCRKKISTKYRTYYTFALQRTVTKIRLDIFDISAFSKQLNKK